MNRLDYFMSRKHLNRFWWFQRFDYLPSIYAELSDDEFALLVDWFEETERLNMIGECNIPAMSAMLGFVQGNGIDAIVQCGHYAGYSSLLFGWALRRMGKKRGLFSVDISEKATAFTQKWIEKADLQEYVSIVINNSAYEELPIEASIYFATEVTDEYLKTFASSYPRWPKMIFIDSSHQYAHTLNELDLWYEALTRGGLMFLHDVTEQGAGYDRTNQGGVQRALNEWKASHSAQVIGIQGGVYQDGCGLGVIQK